MKAFRSAVIGCGNISRRHTEALTGSALAELVAVCDIREDRAAAAGEKFGVPYYTDYRDVLAREDIDCIHICTPHYMHAPIAIAACAAGKHVFTEKPMATTPEDAEAMIRAAEAAGKPHLDEIYRGSLCRCIRRFDRAAHRKQLFAADGLNLAHTAAGVDGGHDLFVDIGNDQGIDGLFLCNVFACLNGGVDLCHFTEHYHDVFAGAGRCSGYQLHVCGLEHGIGRFHSLGNADDLDGAKRCGCCHLQSASFLICRRRFCRR